MPYLKNREERKILDDVVEALGQYHVANVSGRLNYVLFALCKRYVPLSYEALRNFLAEMNEAEHEIRRRILAPYEDKKIKQNGDVE